MLRIATLPALLGALAIVLLLSSIKAPVGYAQSQRTGTVVGTVQDSTGRPAEYVNVGIEGTPLGAATDERGKYIIYNVPAGAQTVVATAVGFEPMRRKIAVQAGTSNKTDFTLVQSIEELNEVVVTGQKRRTSTVTKTMTPLENLPISVQIVGEELMHQQQITDVRDAVKNISGVTATGTYNGGYTYYSSRGFDMSNWSNFRRNGMFIWNMGHHFNDNIAQIEVLKGPASILYGDVAPGGIINFVTKKPLAYDYRRAEVKVGEYGLFRPTVDLSGPIGSGAVRYRLNATYETSQSFRDEVENETIMLAPTLAWQITPALEWTVEATYKHDDRVGDPGLVSPDGTFEGLQRLDIGTFLGEPNATYTFEDKSLFSTLDYFVSDQWKLSNTTYYTRTDRTPYNIYLSGTSADANGMLERSQYYFHQWFDGWGSTLDLTGSFATGPLAHEVVIGGDYMYNDSRFTNGVSRTLETDINVFDPEYDEAVLEEDPMEWSNSVFFYQRFGIFAQDQIQLFQDRVHILLGLRFNVTETGNKYDNPSDAPEGYETNTDRPFSPRLGLVYKPMDWLSLYGSYAESYEMNGSDWIDPSIFVPPTTAEQFEVGAKTSLLGEQLGVTLSAFRINKRDVYWFINTDEAPGFDFISFSAEQGYATYQGGLHRSQGLELDVNGRITNNWSVNATAAYIDATVEEDPAFEAGNQLGGTPRESASLWTRYAFDETVWSGRLDGLEVGYGLYYRGSFYQSATNDPAAEVDAFTSMDAMIGYTYGAVTARLNVTNVTNNEGYLTNFGVYEPLWVRRAVLSLAARF